VVNFIISRERKGDLCEEFISKTSHAKCIHFLVCFVSRKMQMNAGILKKMHYKFSAHKNRSTNNMKFGLILTVPICNKRASKTQNVKFGA
jgi:hypothetical protein